MPDMILAIDGLRRLRWFMTGRFWPSVSHNFFSLEGKGRKLVGMEGCMGLRLCLPTSCRIGLSSELMVEFVVNMGRFSPRCDCFVTESVGFMTCSECVRGTTAFNHFQMHFSVVAVCDVGCAL